MELKEEQTNNKNKIQKNDAENILDIIDYGIYGVIDVSSACQRLGLKFERKNLSGILKELQNLKTNILLENKKRGIKDERK